MMQVIDYIFYRMYIAYEKANEGPLFSTVLLFSTFFAIYISIFVLILCHQFLHVSKIVFMLIYIIIGIVGAIITLRRYNKKKRNEILVRYRYHKCNRWIKNWMIYTGLVLLFPVAPLTIPLWGILFNFIRSLVV